MDDRQSLIGYYERTLVDYWDKYRRNSPQCSRQQARRWFYFYNALRHKCLT